MSLFVDYFKWFYLSLKIEIIFSRFMCTYPIDTTRYKNNQITFPLKIIKKKSKKFKVFNTFLIFFHWIFFILSSANTHFICDYLPHLPGNSSSFFSTLSYLLSIFNIITLLVCIGLVFIVNHSAEFNPSNPLKSTYSSLKLLEYGLIIIT